MTPAIPAAVMTSASDGKESQQRRREARRCERGRAHVVERAEAIEWVGRDRWRARPRGRAAASAAGVGWRADRPVRRHIGHLPHRRIHLVDRLERQLLADVGDDADDGEPRPAAVGRDPLADRRSPRASCWRRRTDSRRPPAVHRGCRTPQRTVRRAAECPSRGSSRRSRSSARRAARCATLSPPGPPRHARRSAGHQIDPPACSSSGMVPVAPTAVTPGIACRFASRRSR